MLTNKKILAAARLLLKTAQPMQADKALPTARPASFLVSLFPALVLLLSVRP